MKFSRAALATLLLVVLLGFAPAKPAAAQEVYVCNTGISGPAKAVLGFGLYYARGGGSIWCDQALITTIIVTISGAGATGEEGDAVTGTYAFARAEAFCTPGELPWRVSLAGEGKNIGSTGYGIDSQSGTLDCTLIIQPPQP